MGYYIRVLGITDKTINHKTILKSNRKIGHIDIQGGTVENWTQIIVKNNDGVVLTIERDPIEENSLGKEELKEFSGTIEDCFPKKAVNWLNNFFKKVRVIIGFLWICYHPQ